MTRYRNKLKVSYALNASNNSKFSNEIRKQMRTCESKIIKRHANTLNLLIYKYIIDPYTLLIVPTCILERVTIESVDTCYMQIDFLCNTYMTKIEAILTVNFQVD